MKNILVVGGAGYIGSHMVKMLGEQGFSVTTLDNLSSGREESILFGDFYKGDMQDENLVCKILQEKKIDLVMHFASNIEVAESKINPQKYYLNNVVNTISLINSMLTCDVKNFIFSSTAAIFGIPKLKRIDEEAPKDPINAYGSSKLMIEQILDDYDVAYLFRSICFRYFNAASADPDGNIGEMHDPETHLIPLMIRAYLKKEPFYIFGDDYPTIDGSCIRDFIHVNDICRAHLQGVEHLFKEKTSNKFNLGNDKGYSIKEVISSFENLVGEKIDLIQEQRRPGDPPILVADSSKARNILNWSPLYSSINNILKDALSFYEKRI